MVSNFLIRFILYLAHAAVCACTVSRVCCIYCIASHHHMQTHRTHKIYMLQRLKRPSADKVLAHSQTVASILHHHVPCVCNKQIGIDILSAHNCDHISHGLAGWQHTIQSNPILSIIVLVVLARFFFYFFSLSFSTTIDCSQSRYVVWLCNIWQAFKNLLQF